MKEAEPIHKFQQTRRTIPNAKLQELMSTYKFAFTPENSNDEGYVTEKVYAVLRAGEDGFDFSGKIHLALKSALCTL